MASTDASPEGSTGFEHRSCPACGSTDHAEEVRSARRAEDLSFEELRGAWNGLFHEKTFFSYHRCRACGLLFAPTFFSNAQLSDLYSAMPPNMDAVPTDALAATQRGYWRDVVRSGAKLDGGYLEIGPDVGYIVNHAASEGQFDRFWLFEPNRAVHAELAAATHGKPNFISTEMDDLSPVPDGSVGLAVMVMVMDHLLDPVGTLAQIRRKLKADGTLMIVTHNEASLLRKLMGAKFPPFCMQHPEVYSPASMHEVLTRAGFGKVDVARSRNYFPVDFLGKHVAWALGMKLQTVPLPKAAIGLKLGNMITLAAH